MNFRSCSLSHRPRPTSPSPAQADLLEAARSQIAGTVSQSEVRNLPLNGRNFLDLALLVPGVSPTNIASTQLFAETSAVPGDGLSVGSQRNLSNNFIVDGLSANDDAAGLSGIPYGVDAVRAVPGGHLGRTGGVGARARRLRQRRDEKRHQHACTATVYGYFRDDAFNAANRSLGTTLPMNQKQYGVSMGGPIARDRTFLLRERRAAEAGPVGPDHDLAGERQRHQRPAGGDRLSGLARSRPASIRTP